MMTTKVTVGVGEEEPIVYEDCHASTYSDGLLVIRNLGGVIVTSFVKGAWKEVTTTA